MVRLIDNLLLYLSLKIGYFNIFSVLNATNSKQMCGEKWLDVGFELAICGLEKTTSPTVPQPLPTLLVFHTWLYFSQN